MSSSNSSATNLAEKFLEQLAEQTALIFSASNIPLDDGEIDMLDYYCGVDEVTVSK